MSATHFEDEVKAALEDAYRPAPWLLASSIEAVRRGGRPRRTWAWAAAVAAVLVLAVSLGIFESIRPAGVSTPLPTHGSPIAPNSPVPFAGAPPSISTAPDPRSDAAIAYDPLTRQTVMFGGLPGSHGDTWIWDGRAWALQHPAVSPHGRFGATMAFDPDLGGVVLIGGNPNSSTNAAVDADMRATWLWRDGGWQVVQTAHTPVPENYYFGWRAFVAFDGKSDELVLTSVTGMPHVGPCSADTWTFDGHDWQHRTPAEALPATVRLLTADGPSGHVMAVLDPREALVAAGFFTPACGSDQHAARALPSTSTWGWTGSNWVQLEAGSLPASGVGGDAGGTLFGAHAALVALDGYVWKWTGSTWTRSQTAGPRARGSAAVSQDRNGRMVMFGGDLQVDPYYLGDTWLWDGTRWAKVPYAGKPSSASR